jgi:hypothetical protein
VLGVVGVYEWHNCLGFSTRTFLNKKYKSDHGLKSVDDVIDHTRSRLDLGPPSSSSSSEEEAYPNESTAQLFSFEWFSNHEEAREYFCGLQKGAFEWLQEHFIPEVLYLCLFVAD